MKKNLLKLLTLVLALVMVVTVFAGCKKADEETDAPTQGSEETPTETQGAARLTSTSRPLHSS